LGPDESYWGAQVIVNLFAAIPFIGPDLALLIRGDYVVGDATLNRFFSFHVIAVPLVLLGLVVAHIIALHEVGSNNPDGIEIKANKDANGHPVDGIPFHPYYTVHDIFAVSVFLMVFSAIVFFAPEFGGYFLEYNNFIPGRSVQDAAAHRAGLVLHAVYSMLRAITSEMMYALIACVLGRRLALAVLKVKHAELPQARHPGGCRWRLPLMMGTSMQVLGRGGDGWRRHHPVLPALAGLQPGQVDPLPPDWHKYLYASSCSTSWCWPTWVCSRRRRSASACRRSVRCSISASSC
jgi:ubiquinol-cytochrome c reductase cytochrome b subunit